MLNNRGKNIMITTSVMNLSVSENTFEKNAAIIIKSKETKEGRLFEYVTVPHVADRTEKAVLKAAIKFVFDYLAIYKTDAEVAEHLYAPGAADTYHAGDARYEDVNKDGQIDDNDLQNLGNPFPWLTYGLNGSVNWHNWDLQVFRGSWP